jgi:AraC-like DNA-binding protein
VRVLDAGASVRSAAAQAGLSERQLARRFADRVGITPKIFGRVMRLQRASAALAAGASALAASADAGYADQAHFTREARELAGATPSVLASETFKAEDGAAE